MNLIERARQAALQGGAPVNDLLVDLATSIEALKEDIDAMRPAPPAPDTPNTGRTGKYRKLVDPGSPKKRERAMTGLIAAVGFGAAVLIDIVVRLVT
jgi:hypothetical protein